MICGDCLDDLRSETDPLAERLFGKVISILLFDDTTD